MRTVQNGRLPRQHGSVGQRRGPPRRQAPGCQWGHRAEPPLTTSRAARQRKIRTHTGSKRIKWNPRHLSARHSPAVFGRGTPWARQLSLHSLASTGASAHGVPAQEGKLMKGHAPTPEREPVHTRTSRSARRRRPAAKPVSRDALRSEVADNVSRFLAEGRHHPGAHRRHRLRSRGEPRQDAVPRHGVGRLKTRRVHGAGSVCLRLHPRCVYSRHPWPVVRKQPVLFRHVPLPHSPWCRCSDRVADPERSGSQGQSGRPRPTRHPCDPATTRRRHRSTRQRPGPSLLDSTDSRTVADST